MQLLNASLPAAMVALVVAGFFVSIVVLAFAEVRQAWRAGHAR